MNKTQRAVLALITVIAVLAVCFLISREAPQAAGSAASREEKVANAKPSLPARAASSAVSARPLASKAVAAKPLPPPPAGAVKVQPADPAAPAAIRAFRDWARDYFLAEPAARAALEPRGMALAEEHRQALAVMIPENPRGALENAVPMVVRQDLPASIVEKLEQRINSRGQLLVAGVVPSAANAASQSPGVKRFFVPEGQDPIANKPVRYSAYVYGKRAPSHTLESTRVSGVAVGGSMAVLDTVIRRLEVGERPDSTKQAVTTCPISGIDTELALKPGEPLPPVTEQTQVVEDDQVVRYFCAGGHIGEYEEQLAGEERQSHWRRLGVAAEGSTGGAMQPFNPPPGWTTGTSTLLYIRCAFPEQGYDPQSEAECYTALEQTTDYFMENSRGKFYLSPTVAPLVVLPHPESWYNASRDSNNQPDGDFVIYYQARELAARMGYDTANYNLDVVRWNNGPGSYGGLGSVGGKLVILKTSAVGVLMHELGHNLSLWHANYWQTNPATSTGAGTNNEYGNIYDVMGSSGSLGHYVAPHKNRISWLTSDQVHEIRGNGTYRIFQTDQGHASAGSRYAARIPRDSDRNYWLEMRQQFTGVPALFNGLMLTWDDWGYDAGYGSNGGAQLIDTTPGSGSLPDTRTDAGIAVGRTFTDTELDLHITPLTKSTTSPPYIDVVVNKGPFPGNRAPTLSVIASSLTPAAGDSVTLTASASDPDGDAVAYYWDYGDGTFSSTGTRSESKIWALPGVFRAVCTATDMKGKKTVRGLTITVGGGNSTYTISGTITDAAGDPMAGVYVANRALSGTPSQTNVNGIAIANFRYAITDSNGLYMLTNIATGTNITVTPHVPPYTFTPSFTNPISNVQSNLTARNFAISNTISGNRLTVAVTDGAMTESPAATDTATITITRSATAGTFAVPLMQASSGTATRNTDYTITPAPTLLNNGNGPFGWSMAANIGTLTLTIIPQNDGASEGIEFAVLEFPETPGVTRVGPKTVSIPITDDESTAPVVTLFQTEPSSSEAGDAASLVVQRAGATTNPLTVDVTYSGVAVHGVDFNSPTSVTIPVGASSVNLALVPFDDIYAEGLEFGTVSLASSPAYERDSRQRSAQFFIADNDQPVLKLEALDAAAAEAGANPGKFRVTRTARDVSQPLTVQYSMGGSALQGSDYRRVDGAIVIPAHELYAEIEIIPLDDSVDEPDQTVICRLATDDAYAIDATTTVAAPIPGQAVVTIVDNDTSEVIIRTLPVAGGRIVEPNGTLPALTSVFRVSRAATGAGITVPIVFSGTATNGSDYTVSATSVSFLATDTQVDIRLTITDDSANEPVETIIATVGTGSGYKLGRETSATATIQDGDQVTVDISLADSGFDMDGIREDSGSFEFFVGRSGGTTGNLDVPFTITGTATNPADFTISPASIVTIPAGQSGARITVTPVDDAVGEGTETIILTLGNSTAWGAGARTATARIVDDENIGGVSPPSVQFSAASSTANERNGSAAITHSIPVAITGTRAGPVSVSYYVSAGSAHGLGVDYTLSGTLGFAIADTVKNITLTTTPDLQPEENETVSITLINNIGTNIGATSTHTVTIVDLAVPETLTGTVSNDPGTTATLRAKAVANGYATNAWFEWGTSATAFPNSTTPEAIGTGHSLVDLTPATITGLAYPGTYYYRSVASNSAGTTRGITRIIRTAAAPTGNTLLTPIHNANSATLLGTLNPKNRNAEVWFEWGETTAYGNLTPRQGVVSGNADVSVSAPITGLTEGTLYHYRMIAQTSLGTVTGDDKVVAAIPQIVAGELFVNLLAKHPSAGSAAWFNQGTMGDFNRLGAPTVEPNVASTGLAGVFFDDSAAAYEGASAASADITGNSNRSIEVWAYNPGRGTADELVTLGRDGIRTRVTLTDGQTNDVQHGGDPGAAAPPLALAGSWHHFAYTYDGARNATLYIDGVKKIAKKLTGDLATATDAMLLGASRDATGAVLPSFQGYINTVRVHGGLLSATDVKTNFDLGPTTPAASAPIVVTRGASVITPNSATLNAQVVAAGFATTAWIEYGTSTNYDNATAPVAVPAGWKPTAIVMPVTGLATGFEYHFRVVARNSQGTVPGEDSVFIPSSIANAGILYADLRATDGSAGSASWHNYGALGDFTASGSPALNASTSGSGIPGVAFDGTAAAYFSDTPAPPDIAGDSDRTIETWFYNPTLDLTAETIAHLGRRDRNGSTLQMAAGSFTMWDTNSGSPTSWTSSFAAQPAPSGWHHLVIAASPAGINTYLDGVASASLPAVLDTRAESVTIGAALDAARALVFGADGFTGSLNTLRIHGGLLTPAQVTANFAAGPARDPAVIEPPQATPIAATLVTAASATIAGSITPGNAATSYWFEYGETIALGSSTAPRSLASLFASQTVSEAIGGLTSGVTYYYRVVAQNAGGTTPSDRMSFTATGSIAGLPTATTNAAGDIALGGKAKLNGVAGSGGQASQAWFEYGLGTALNLSTAKTAITAATPTRTLAIALTGLLPHASYSARLVVENAAGRVAGSTVSFNTLNNTPVATPGSAKLVEDMPTPLALKGSDADKEPITFVITTPAANGNVAFIGGLWVYTPAAHYVGTDTFMFAATDGAATSTPALFTLTIASAKDVPVAVAGSASGDEDNDILGTVTATEPDGASGALTFARATSPNHGSVTINAATGDFTYTPDGDYAGSDSFTFTASNPNGTSRPAIITLSLTSTPDSPVASNSTAWTEEDVPVTGQAIARDPDGDSVSFTKLTEPSSGVVTFPSTGAWSYEPDLGFVGEDSFTFKATANGQDSAIATITIIVGSAVADDATFTGVRDDLITGTLTATDPTGQPLTFASVRDPLHGELFVMPDGTFLYNPEPYYVGTDSFTFQANNGTSLSNEGTITLIITESTPQWIWIGGAKVAKQPGNYGSLGASSPNNTPGARFEAAYWTGSNETVWVFGGNGQATGSAAGLLNDLWKNDGTGQWTWVSGSNTTNSPARYGAQGIASPTNSPGARQAAATWVGQDGKLYLFGGNGRNGSLKDVGLLNDLWSYDPTTNQWTWLKGSQAVNAIGSDGNGGFSPSTATPGARSGAAAWVGADGRLYLFGGQGLAVTPGLKPGPLNDLWVYDPASNLWSWLRGPGGLGTPGTYGQRGLPSGSAWPGARSFATSWVGVDGEFYLFGGNGLSAAPAKLGNLNDLWSFNPLSGAWTWRQGSNASGSLGSYGTLGLPSPQNQPPARAGAVAWVSGAGEAWIFGGQGTGSLNDVWRYNSIANEWTWMKGPATTNGPGIYTATPGLASPSTTPGARRGGAALLGEGGDIYLFGGGVASSPFNDFWRLTTPKSPGLSQIAAESVTTTTADVSIKLQPNGFETDLTLRLWAVTDPGTVFQQTLPSPIGGTTGSVQTFSLTGLTPSTHYRAQVVAQSDAGEGLSHQLAFLTLGAPPAVPTIRFAAASSTVDESTLVTNLDVVLSNPAPASFTLPFTLGGTATAGTGGDYVQPSGSLSFTKGQISGVITIALTADPADEPDETLVVTLGTPLGTVLPTLAAPISHSVTITDDDEAPAITADPASNIAAIGSSVTLNATATGSNLAYQWYFNGAKLNNSTTVTGATTNSLSLSRLASTQAGRYTVEVKNVLNTVTSKAGDLYLVDTSSPGRLVIAANGKTTFNAKAYGPGGAADFGFAWHFDGAPMADAPVRVLGSLTSALTINPLIAADSGAYHCTVNVLALPALSLDTGITNLSVPTAAPQLTPVTPLPTGVVGTPYSYQVLFSDTSPSSRAPLSFSAVGLPKGLSLNTATGLISGKPTAPGDSTVVITAKNPVGTSLAINSINTTLKILAVPTRVIGTYAAVASRDVATGNLGGRFDLTTTALGTYTAKLTLGTFSATASGALSTLNNGTAVTSVSGTASFLRKGIVEPVEVAFDLDLTDDSLTATLTDQRDSEQADLFGYRNAWSTAQPTTIPGYSGDYTLLLEGDLLSLGDVQIPQGLGFAAFTIAPDGKTSIVGKTADGAAFTIATHTGPIGELPGIFALFGTRSSLAASPLSTPAITLAGSPAGEDNTLDATVSWNKAPADAKSQDLAYRAGFAPIFLSVLGGKYKAPTGDELFMDLRRTTSVTDYNIAVTLFEGGLSEDEQPWMGFNISNTGTAGKQTITPPKAGSSDNLSSMTFVLTAKPAGQFSGKATLLHRDDPKLNRPVTYQGTVVRQGTTYYNGGFSLIPQLPEPGQTLKTSPLLSGSVYLEGL